MQLVSASILTIGSEDNMSKSEQQEPQPVMIWLNANTLVEFISAVIRQIDEFHMPEYRRLGEPVLIFVIPQKIEEWINPHRTIHQGIVIEFDYDR